MATRFVSIPSYRLISTLNDVAEKVTSAGGHADWIVQGSENVLGIVLPDGRGALKVYTSVAVGDTEARGCGEDAIRFVVGRLDHTGSFRPLAKSQKVLRTAPALPTEAERVDAFLARLVEQLRDAYRAAKVGQVAA